MTYTPNEKALEAAARAMANRYVVDDTGTIKKVPWQNLTAWANDAITAYMAEMERMGMARSAWLFEGMAQWEAVTNRVEDHDSIIIKLEPQT